MSLNSIVNNLWRLQKFKQAQGRAEIPVDSQKEYFQEMRKFLKIMRVKEQFFVDLLMRKESGVNYHLNLVIGTHQKNQILERKVIQRLKEFKLDKSKTQFLGILRDFLTCFEKVMAIWDKTIQKVGKIDPVIRRQALKLYSLHKTTLYHTHYELLVEDQFQLTKLISASVELQNIRIQTYLPSQTNLVLDIFQKSKTLFLHEKSCRGSSIISGGLKDNALKESQQQVRGDMRMKIFDSLISTTSYKSPDFPRAVEMKQNSRFNATQAISSKFVRKWSVNQEGKETSFEKSLRRRKRIKITENCIIEKEIPSDPFDENIEIIEICNFKKLKELTSQITKWQQIAKNMSEWEIKTQTKIKTRERVQTYQHNKNIFNLYSMMQLRKVQVDDYLYHKIYQMQLQKERNRRIIQTRKEWESCFANNAAIYQQKQSAKK